MTFYSRLYIMMVKLKVSDDHPAWHTNKSMAYHIACRLNIQNERKGEIIITDEIIDWLEANMPKTKMQVRAHV